MKVSKGFLFDFFLIIIPFNFIVDFLYYLGDQFSIVSIIRIVVNFLFIILFYLVEPKFKNSKFYILYFMLGYWVLLIFFSSDITYSILEFVKVSSTLLFLPISYYLIDSIDKFRLFIKYSYSILIMYIVFVVLSNMYNIGDISYMNEDSTVFKVALGDAKLYAPAFFVGLLPFFLSNKILKSKFYWSLVGLITLIILLLTIRRTVVVIMFSLPILFQLFKGNVKNIVLFSFSIVFLLLLSFPLFEDQFFERLNERDYLTDSSYSYEEEGRYQELFLVLDTFNSSGSILWNYLFGCEAFNTIGNYGFFKDRPIHVDYTYVFFSSGLIGLFFYLFLFSKVFYIGFNFRKSINFKSLYNFYIQFIVLFIVVVFVGFSGNVWAITYKICSFSLLGSFCGLFRSNYYLNVKEIY